MTTLENPTLRDFTATVGEDFELITGTGGITLRLIAAEGNTVRFQGQPAVELPTASYRLQNTTIGALDLTLTHVGADQAGSYFEATVAS